MTACSNEGGLPAPTTTVSMSATAAPSPTTSKPKVSKKAFAKALKNFDVSVDEFTNLVTASPKASRSNPKLFQTEAPNSGAGVSVIIFSKQGKNKFALWSEYIGELSLGFRSVWLKAGNKSFQIDIPIKSLIVDTSQGFVDEYAITQLNTTQVTEFCLLTRSHDVKMRLEGSVPGTPWPEGILLNNGALRAGCKVWEGLGQGFKLD